MATSTRLKACLYSFTSPGGPMYPTRAVRHAAWDALDLLFPVSESLFFLFINLASQRQELKLNNRVSWKQHVKQKEKREAIIPLSGLLSR